MTDETKPAPAATPVASPAPAPAAAPAPVNKAPESTKVQPRVGASLITNPAPPVDEDAPVKEATPSVPQSTIDEMEAGRKALERNKPVASALEAARAKDAEAPSKA